MSTKQTASTWSEIPSATQMNPADWKLPNWQPGRIIRCGSLSFTHPLHTENSTIYTFMITMAYLLFWIHDVTARDHIHVHEVWQGLTRLRTYTEFRVTFGYPLNKAYIPFQSIKYCPVPELFDDTADRSSRGWVMHQPGVNPLPPE